MRRLLSVLALLSAVTAQVLLVAAPANAYEVRVTIFGAGTVTETTPADLLGSACTTSATNPTGTLGATCLAGTPSGDYGWGWEVAYVAAARPGYRFVRWESDGTTRSGVICDRSTPPATTTTYTGTTCRFATFDNLQVRAVFVDDTNPVMSSLTGPNQPVNGPATFTFSAQSDPTLQRFECRVAGVHDWQTCTSGQQENPAASGSYTFEVRAVDFSGNKSGISTWNWTVDKITPETSVSLSPSGTVRSTSASFEFTSNESGSFECSLDDAAFTACGSPKNYSGLGQGSHDFTVRAVDVAGNRDLTPVTRTWSVDSVAPTVESRTPTGRTVSRDAKPAVTFSEAMREGTVEAASSGKPLAFYLTLGGTKVAATVTYTETSTGVFRAVLAPANRLRAGKEYRVVLSERAKDLAGNAVGGTSWRFRTRG